MPAVTAEEGEGAERAEADEAPTRILCGLRRCAQERSGETMRAMRQGEQAEDHQRMAQSESRADAGGAEAPEDGAQGGEPPVRLGTAARAQSEGGMIRVTLPLPPKACSPNARGHWRTRSKAIKAYRACASLLARRPAEHQLRWREASIAVTWFSRTRTRPDADNALASLKAAFDGLVDAGVLADDREVTFAPIRFEVDKADPRVEITVEPT
jgi:crossover junction endodeoxyribonuclease RusA